MNCCGTVEGGCSEKPRHGFFQGGYERVASVVEGGFTMFHMMYDGFGILFF